MVKGVDWTKVIELLIVFFTYLGGMRHGKVRERKKKAKILEEKI